MMRVAYVCADPGVPVFGCKGCSIHVQAVVHALTRLGASVTLFATRASGQPPAGLKQIRLVPLPVPPGSGADRERAAAAANDELRSALGREKPFDLVYERYSLWSFAAMEHARAAGLPALLEVNAPLIEEQAVYRTLVDRDMAESASARAFGAATALLAVSREVASHLERDPAARGRVHVVPNGVEPARFPPNISCALPAPPGVLTIGFLGSLKPWHGLPVLVDAFHRLQRRNAHTRLLIVGDGTERAHIEQDLAARGLHESARFTGAVPPDRVAAYLASMDVAVAPYEAPDFYFSPLKLLEYMAAGLPVVTSRVGQLAELIDDGVTGILCPPGDPGALATALERLCCRPRLRARLGAAARRAVRRDHTWDAVARRILELAFRGRAAAVAAGRGA